MANPTALSAFVGFPALPPVASAKGGVMENPHRKVRICPHMSTFVRIPARRSFGEGGSPHFCPPDWSREYPWCFSRVFKGLESGTTHHSHSKDKQELDHRQPGLSRTENELLCILWIKNFANECPLMTQSGHCRGWCKGVLECPTSCARTGSHRRRGRRRERRNIAASARPRPSLGGASSRTTGCRP